VASEAGLVAAWELYRLARASGRTPWEVLHDKHVAFNVTCQRAHDRVQQMRFGLTMDAVKAGDDLGVGRVIAALQLIHGD
jgi:hypothetical protein